MKIAYSKTNCFDAKIETVNKKISANIKSTNGPELALEDGSRLLFSNPSQHFRVMTDKDISTNPQEINIDKFSEKYFVVYDDVNFAYYDGFSIIEVVEYKVLGEPVYRFIPVYRFNIE